MGPQRKPQHVFSLIGLGIVDSVATILVSLFTTGEGEIFIPIILGFFCGQAGAIIIWSVFGGLPSYYRAPVGVALTSLFLAIVGSPLFINLYLQSGMRDVGYFLPIPFFILVIIFLLWWAKHSFGWRFKNQTGQRRFSIIDLLVAISTVGFCLALVRIGLSSSNALRVPSSLILFVVCVGWTMVLVLPIARAAFFIQGEKRERYLIGFSSILLLGLFLVPMVFGGNPAMALPASMIICFCHGVLLVTLYLCLRYLRNCGIIVPQQDIYDEMTE